jgi:hypothetical protein
MTIDAAAHKKQYELLPPEKKASLLETRAEQRHEHLTDKPIGPMARKSVQGRLLYHL